MIFDCWCRCSDWWSPHTHDPTTREPIPFFDEEVETEESVKEAGGTLPSMHSRRSLSADRGTP